MRPSRITASSSPPSSAITTIGLSWESIEPAHVAYLPLKAMLRAFLRWPPSKSMPSRTSSSWAPDFSRASISSSDSGLSVISIAAPSDARSLRFRIASWTK
jgi:hypothetical protein